MIDPNNIINLNRNTAEKEELLLFLVCVAGKKATTVARQLQEFLKPMSQNDTPFSYVRTFGSQEALREYLEKKKLFGCYTSRSKAFWQLVHLDADLDTISLENLLRVHGIGLKSASCYLLWTQEDVRVAGLDTHVLAELRDLGYDAPRSTPGNLKEYDKWQEVVLKLVDQSGLSPAEWDLQLWKRRSNKTQTPLEVTQT
jgi:thermostable 8-oxoguanine DNA glycosylase